MINGIGSSSYYYDLSATRNQQPDSFEDTDTDESGSLNAAEVAALAGNVSEATGTEVDADKLMTRLDTDGDGSVSHAEFEAGRAEWGVEEAERVDVQMLYQMLTSDAGEYDITETDPFDLNGDGTLDTEELTAKYGSLFEEYSSNGEAGEMAAQVSIQV